MRVRMVQLVNFIGGVVRGVPPTVLTLPLQTSILAAFVISFGIDRDIRKAFVVHSVVSVQSTQDFGKKKFSIMDRNAQGIPAIQDECTTTCTKVVRTNKVFPGVPPSTFRLS